MIAYAVVQTRNVQLTDLIVGIFLHRKNAEKYVLKECHQYGDGISSLTGNALPFGSYEDYSNKSGLQYYMYDRPALKIVETELMDGTDHIR